MTFAEKAIKACNKAKKVKYGIFVCHSEHLKVGPKRIKVSVTFDENDIYRLYHLCQKYSEGCIAAFIKQVVQTELTASNEEIRQDLEQIKKEIDKEAEDLLSDSF